MRLRNGRPSQICPRYALHFLNQAGDHDAVVFDLVHEINLLLRQLTVPGDFSVLVLQGFFLLCKYLTAFFADSTVSPIRPSPTLQFLQSNPLAAFVA